MSWQDILMSTVFVLIALLLIFTRFRLENPFQKDVPASNHAEKKQGHNGDKKSSDHHNDGGESKSQGFFSNPKAKSYLKSILTILLLVVVVAFIWRQLGEREHSEDQTTSHAYEQMEETHDNVNQVKYTSGTSGLVSQLFVRMPLVTPTGDQWSAWVSVRSGENFFICESDEGLLCKTTESDPQKVVFRLQCRDLSGRTHDWSETSCRDAVAFRVQSKGPEPVRTIHWTEPY